MDPQHFDSLARTLATLGSRRRLVALLTALPIGAVLTGVRDEASAAKRKKRTFPLPDCEPPLTRAGCTCSGSIDRIGRCTPNWVCPRGANLAGANLYGCILFGASMVGANLTSTILNDAFLGDADLTGATITGDLQGVWLRSAVLRGTRFEPRFISGLPTRSHFVNLLDADFRDAAVRVNGWFNPEHQGLTLCPDGTTASLSSSRSCCGHFLAGKGPKSCAF
jgi:hypothetical protein